MNDRSRPHRVAIYFAPDPESEAWVRGSTWLGRCAWRGQPLTQAPVDGLSPAQFEAVTAEPRRYGWHATLKAPFRLAPGQDLGSVRAALQRLCAGRRPFDIGSLQVARLDGFLALRPSPAEAALDALAADCVRALRPLAAPLDEAELARRRRAGLTPEQDALLLAWGYPWVMQHFRFHLSLTGPLAALGSEAQSHLLAAATRHFEDLPSWRVDRLSVFVEPEAGADFLLHEQVAFHP